MADIKSIAVRLTADTAQFKSAMKGGGSVVDNFGKTVAVGMAAAGTAMIAFGLKSADTYVNLGKEVMKMSRISGDSVEQMSKFRFAGQQAGVSADTLSTGMKFLQKNMAAGKDEFVKLGVATKDSNGKFRDTHDVFLDVADKISKLGTATEKTDAIVKIFGKSGMDLGPLLAKGKQGIIDLENQAQKYGLVLSQDNVKDIQANIKAHRQLDAAMQGLQVRIGQDVLPKLTTMTEFFAKLPGPIMENIVPITGVAGALIGLAVIGPKVWEIGSKIVSTIKDMGSSAAAGGIAIGGALAVYEIWNARMQEAYKNASALGDVVSKANASDTYAGMGNRIGKITDQIASLSTEIDNSHAPWDADYRAEMEAYKTQLEKSRDATQGQIDRIDQMSAATGKSKDEVKKWLDQQTAAGVTFDSTGLALASFTGKVDLSTLSSEEAADAIKSMDENLKAYMQTEQELLNPQLAMLDSVQKLTDARKKDADAQTALAQAQYNYSLVKGAGSQQEKDALVALGKAQDDATKSSTDLVRANMDMDGSVATLENAFKTGRASVEDTKATLQGWVEQGRMTQAQADRVSFALGLTKAYADRLDGTTATVTVEMALKGGQAVNSFISSIGASVTAGIGHRATGGSLNDGWTMVGENGPELAEKRGGAVMIHSNAATSRMLSPVGAASSSGGNSSSVTNVFHITPSLPNYMGDSQQLSQKLTDMVRDAVRAA